MSKTEGKDLDSLQIINFIHLWAGWLEFVFSVEHAKPGCDRKPGFF